MSVLADGVQGLQHDLIHGRKDLGKGCGRDFAHFNEFDHDFFGHLDGFFFFFMHGETLRAARPGLATKKPVLWGNGLITAIKDLDGQKTGITGTEAIPRFLVIFYYTPLAPPFPACAGTGPGRASRKKFKKRGF